MEPSAAARARSLRASIAATFRALRRSLGRGGGIDPAGLHLEAARRPRVGGGDPFELGTLDAEGVILALRVCDLRNELAVLRAGNGAEACGARCRDGHACRAPAVRGRRRCKLHGGASTGPTTAEGRERCRVGAIAQRNGVPFDVAVEFVRASHPPHQTPRDRLLAYLAARAAPDEATPLTAET